MKGLFGGVALCKAKLSINEDDVKFEGNPKTKDDIKIEYDLKMSYCAIIFVKLQS